jgi:hypothetical protein
MAIDQMTALNYDCDMSVSMKSLLPDKLIN